jgi:hypothetical protein
LINDRQKRGCQERQRKCGRDLPPFWLLPYFGRFWTLDRFSQEGIRKMIAYLQRLDACGVAFKSYTEPLLDTDNELIAHMVFGVTSYYTKQEALRISNRTKRRA